MTLTDVLLTWGEVIISVVNVITNSPSQDHTHPNDHSFFKSFTVLNILIQHGWVQRVNTCFAILMNDFEWRKLVFPPCAHSVHRCCTCQPNKCSVVFHTWEQNKMLDQVLDLKSGGNQISFNTFQYLSTSANITQQCSQTCTTFWIQQFWVLLEATIFGMWSLALWDI